jgi:uncharacterized iron-regulated protein
MQGIARALIFGAVLAFSLVLCSHAPTPDKILRVSDGAILSLTEIVDDLSAARLVFVGEIHTVASHHRAQVKVIRALNAHSPSVAIGLEMFRRESQAALDRWVRGELSEKEFQKIYFSNWNYPWPLYRDIFVYAREHKVPLIGLNVPREITRQVAREGFASLSPEQRRDLPMVTCRIDPEYMDFIRRSLAMHGHGGLDFNKFCEAQLVWDTAMAWSLLDYLKKEPKSTVVVIAGKGHSWKPGIPAQIRSRSEVPLRVMLPEIPGRVERGAISEAEADYVWLGLK